MELDDDIPEPLCFVGSVIGIADRAEGGAITWPNRSQWPRGTKTIAHGGPVDDAETGRFSQNVRVYGLCFGQQPLTVRTALTHMADKVAQFVLTGIW